MISASDLWCHIPAAVLCRSKYAQMDGVGHQNQLSSLPGNIMNVRIVYRSYDYQVHAFNKSVILINRTVNFIFHQFSKPTRHKLKTKHFLITLQQLYIYIYIYIWVKCIIYIFNKNQNGKSCSVWSCDTKIWGGIKFSEVEVELTHLTNSVLDFLFT